MASVERYKDRRWRARYRTPDGRSRSQVFARKLDATRWLAEVEHSKLAGAYVDPKAGRITFQAYAEQWRMMQPHRDGTATSVEQQLRRHVYPSLGDRSIGAMLPSEIQALVTRMGQTLAASTVAVVYGRISAVFSAAVRDRVIAVSPCVDVKRPKPSTEVEVVLTTDQVLAIADAILPMYRALVLTMAGTGLRPGEAFGLTVDAAPHDLRREVRVERQLVRVRGRSVVLTSLLKTDSSRRTVPVGQVVIDAVTRHQAEYRPNPELGLVFTNGRGGPLQQSPFAGTWETARERAGVPGWATPHDLRHYYASLLIHRGASVKTVQRRLGHRSAKTTLDTYAALWPDAEDATRAAVDDELSPRLVSPSCHAL